MKRKFGKRDNLTLQFPEGKHGPKLKEPVQPRLLHSEPANHGEWTMISEWTNWKNWYLRF